MLSRFFQPLLCSIGVHVEPGHRCEQGPVVADCVSCRNTMYYYGELAVGNYAYPQLAFVQFPKLLGESPAHALPLVSPAVYQSAPAG